MAGKGKRGPRGPVEPRTVVDLNLWDVLLGLMEPAEAPVPPERASDRGGSGAASGTERKGAGEKVVAAGRKASQGSRRGRKRETGSGAAA